MIGRDRKGHDREMCLRPSRCFEVLPLNLGKLLKAEIAEFGTSILHRHCRLSPSDFPKGFDRKVYIDVLSRRDLSGADRSLAAQVFSSPE